MVTLFTIQFLTDPRCAPVGRQYPFANTQRRVVPHVLIMSAGEFCLPMAFVVDLETINFSIH